jgi:hypothetical protein
MLIGVTWIVTCDSVKLPQNFYSTYMIARCRKVVLITVNLYYSSHRVGNIYISIQSLLFFMALFGVCPGERAECVTSKRK